MKSKWHFQACKAILLIAEFSRIQSNFRQYLEVLLAAILLVLVLCTVSSLIWVVRKGGFVIPTTHYIKQIENHHSLPILVVLHRLVQDALIQRLVNCGGEICFNC